MVTKDIQITRIGNVEDFQEYGVYLLTFKNKLYVGCAYDETIEDRRKSHIKDSISGKTPKDAQLREEGGCSMEVLYTIPTHIAKNKRKKLIKLVENYLIFKCGQSIIEQLIDVKVIDDSLTNFKDILADFMLNSQY